MRQPLFPCKYETWRHRRSGRECAVTAYLVEEGEVEYVYYDYENALFSRKLENFMELFSFVTSP